MAAPASPTASTTTADAASTTTADATDERPTGGSRDGMPVQPKLPSAPGGGRGFPSAIRSTGRVRGVDGLRTLAVGLVMVYHLVPGLLPGGSIGVDIFFTISGFVITRLLVAEYARTGDISMGAFYWRRWLRLVPALMTVCALCAVLAGMTSLPGFGGAWTSVALSATFLVNIVRAAQPGPYSDGTSLLAQNWSLGVEEQFYLLWPPLLRALLHRVRPRTVLIWAAVLCALPVAWRWLLWDPTQAHRIYNGTDTRADQLLAGALLAIAVARLRHDDPRLAALRRWSGRLAWPALGVLGLIVWQIPVTGATAWTESWYTVGFLVTALLSATIVAALELRPRSALSWVLSLAPVAWVGRNLSYGLYLWHYPLGRLLADLGVERGHLVATLAASFAAATASYYLIEQPLNRRWRRRGPGAGRRGGTGGGGARGEALPVPVAAAEQRLARAS
ncbi:acyltransferase family protein [Streptomyces sp. NBC_01497]|uniref:acyltransferase family protein n=1 Tax=Streptomyces sp. NBC_01497 TaxID=2903885 RepID=UPI002E2EE0AE|nr:acyltransferase [Streptomyces sp. NBC_01497]